MSRPIYVAGPISYGGGIDQSVVMRNLVAFRNAAADLREQGYDVISPEEFEQAPGKTWSDYMREGVGAVCAARMVVVLPGWECSKGALLEAHVAHALGLPVVPLAVVLEQVPA